jgi:hypothetical protein
MVAKFFYPGHREGMLDGLVAEGSVVDAHA